MLVFSSGLEGPEGPKVLFFQILARFLARSYSIDKKLIFQGFEGPRGEAGALGLPGDKGKQGNEKFTKRLTETIKHFHVHIDLIHV